MTRLLVATGLLLALAAPAFAQGNEQSARITQSGDSNQRRVIQQGDGNADVSINQVDNGDSSRSEGVSCNRDNDAIACDESALTGRDDGPAPRGGVDSGGGGRATMPPHGSNALPLALGGVFVSAAALAGLGVGLRRRAQALRKRN
jgi:hypothetical protein